MAKRKDTSLSKRGGPVDPGFNLKNRFKAINRQKITDPKRKKKKK